MLVSNWYLRDMGSNPIKALIFSVFFSAIASIVVQLRVSLLNLSIHITNEKQINNESFEYS